MQPHFDCIVVGAGSMGMAAGYYLARDGHQVALFDSFDPPHTQGSHHGETRIIRHAYTTEGDTYVPLAKRAQQLWNELAELTGKPLFLNTGSICIGAPGSGFVAQVERSAHAHQIPLEVLTGAEVRARFEGINVPDNYIGCYEPEAGVLRCEDCISSYRELAQAAGAELHTHTRVTAIEVQPEGVTVQTSKGVFTARRLIVSAGAWSEQLLQSLYGHSLPLRPTRKTVGWFQPAGAAYNAPQHATAAGEFPVFIFDLLQRQYYGFPVLDGLGLKVGRHDSGERINPDDDDRSFIAEDEEELRWLLQRHMPGANGDLTQGKVCIYTFTPDEHFIIDTLPDHPHVAVSAGFSGHGFKFVSVMGEILRDLVMTGQSEFDLSLFRADRFGPNG